MVRALVLKLIILLLALIGVHLPTPYVYVCSVGHNPVTSAPSSCEVLRL